MFASNNLRPNQNARWRVNATLPQNSSCEKRSRQRLAKDCNDRLIGISRTVRPIAESCRCDRLLAPEIATPLFSHIILASRLSQIAKDVFRRAGLYALNGVRVVAIRSR